MGTSRLPTFADADVVDEIEQSLTEFEQQIKKRKQHEKYINWMRISFRLIGFTLAVLVVWRLGQYRGPNNENDCFAAIGNFAPRQNVCKGGTCQMDTALHDDHGATMVPEM